ncbi:MAG TPA: hypothetical protein VH855_07170 [Acetobacteraceae bacterium]
MFAAMVTGTAALLVAALTYVLTKRREHEHAWRNLKRERYTEYVDALSRVVQRGNITGEDRAKYANAVNGISLVAPAAVLTTLYAFQDELSNRSAARADELLNELLHAIRSDIDPSRRSRSAISLRLMSAPPASAS